MMFAISPKVGIDTLRETIFFNQLSQGYEIHHPKAGDFLVVRKYLFEVGGKSKNFNQRKDIPDIYFAVNNTTVGHDNRIP